jgi:hypothetical protein
MVGADAAALREAVTQVIHHVFVWYRTYPTFVGQHVSEFGWAVVTGLEAPVTVLLVHVSDPVPVRLCFADALVELFFVAG